jgi:hypothetical protein
MKFRAHDRRRKLKVGNLSRQGVGLSKAMKNHRRRQSGRKKSAGSGSLFRMMIAGEVGGFFVEISIRLGQLFIQAGIFDAKEPEAF